MLQGSLEELQDDITVVAAHNTVLYLVTLLLIQGYKKGLVACMADQAVSAEQCMGTAWNLLNEEQKAQLLALRGLLAGRQLAHCLQKRHLVEYGVSRYGVAASSRLVAYLLSCCILNILLHA